MFVDVEYSESTITAFGFCACLKNCFASRTFILDVKLFFLSCNDLMLLVRLTLVDAGAKQLSLFSISFFLFSVCEFLYIPVF